MSPEWFGRTETALAASDAPVFLGPESLLEALTGFHVHRGALASVHRRPLPDIEALLASARRLVVIEDLVNHTNLGAIFRAAAALGMDGAVLSPSAADPLYRRAVRVSMGAVFAMPYARAAAWPAAVTDLRSAGFRVVALTPAPDATPLDECRVDNGERIAVLVGTEGGGLSDAAAAAADQRVRIPMTAGVDSLNVASAAAVAFWVFGDR
jgi:tRNA G18 (ribose-2'-O)-methylase SpoU